ncbi:MAG TPA: putative peptidoglycan glycosyltransferase FtsW [Magnetospirillaceae bacterium]|jgi:cell division protein FtsW
MTTFGRTDTSVIGRWWWTVDRWTLAALCALVAIGAILILAASPAVAERIGADHLHFVRRQFIFIPPALATVMAVSLLPPIWIRRLGAIGFIGALLLMALTLVVGDEIKGATRWINFAGLSIQPSEFAKPAFAVAIAWMLAEHRLRVDFPGRAIALGCYLATAALLLLQPDVGMTLVVSAVAFIEFFLAGLPMTWVLLAIILGLCGLVGAYFTFAHVQMRIDHFLNPSTGEGFQVQTALRAFHSGGLFGRGPGEGRVKEILPDAHTDFIMAVAGEEFGLLLCLAVVGLFAFIVLRGFSRTLATENLFVLLATSGLLTQFGLQAVINLASTLHLMPTKGMTLPFISYGGSSTLALALGMGMVLALTRKRYGQEALA